MTNTRSHTEPAAELRQAASGLWQMYVALTNEGFSEKQALVILGKVLASSVKGKPDA